MRFSQRLEIRQGQSLVMTPQLLQAIKLLQFSSIELVNYVDAELERNPLLERAEEPDGPVERTADAFEAGDAASGETEWAPAEMTPERGEIDDRQDTSFDNVFPDDAPALTAEPRSTTGEAGDGLGLSSTNWSGVGGGGRDGDDEVNLEAFVAAQGSLHDSLTEQLQVATEDPVERLIGLSLIDLVEESGYITEPIEPVAERLGVPLAAVERVLAIVQSFEPTGVGARSLAECLRLQLQEQNRFDPCMATLLAHLDLLARRDFASLKRLCGVDDEDLSDMVAEVRRLDPKPGLRFGGSPIQPVIPDVYIRQAADGGWLIELNSDVLPRVLVNQSYLAKVSGSAKSDTDKTYLTDCLQTANWLTRSLEQRARTILKVATEIVRQQDSFLALGVQHLRPLNLRTVADAIGMHESTVSRVTSNKYVATPRGIFEMKYFFTASIAATRGGEAHSAEAVRFRIKQMIDAESPQDVLSDDAIVQKLRDSGVDIARRTVAKYREGLRIPSSVERRREKMALSAAALARG
ncbi:RNA polymerase sigma-54 factor 2 [Alsobacter metallidurans]|uniref:RNA polymerase sigma-54 factor n=1 Tax=Alsobacter metallidurans TaxID=340221 RepID=A0A917I2W8_9HYPH|nr:RNA polymerase factor sigma-54 [Alsobacter metallidurans]GGH08295.1 RNA polymerase sigma-54 factor 2 [Alsobacter metallidurans]